MVRKRIFISIAPICAFVYLFFNGSFCTAQSISISGSVIDSVTHSGLSYSSIVVYGIGDSIVGGAIADAKGKFTVKSNGQKAKYVSISYAGYAARTIALPSNANDNVNLGPIRIKASTILLHSVETRADIARYEEKFDKTVARPSKATIAGALNVFEVMKTLPGVTVDLSNNIRYRGFVPNIYVNSTPAFLIYPDLESIPPDMIEKIELIDTGMRGGGEGKGGIINIILKKQRNDGMSGMATVKPSATTINKLDNLPLFLNLNYKNGRNVLLSNSFMGCTRNEWGYDMARTFSNGFGTDTLSQFSTQKTIGSYKNFDESIGYVFERGTDTRITAAVAFEWNRKVSQAFSSVDEYRTNTGLATNKISMLSCDTNRNPSKSVGLSFWHQYDSTERYVESNLYFALPESINSWDFTGRYYDVTNFSVDSTCSQSIQSHNKGNQMVYCDFTYYRPIAPDTRWVVNYVLDANLSQHSYVNALTNQLPNSLLN